MKKITPQNLGDRQTRPPASAGRKGKDGGAYPAKAGFPKELSASYRRVSLKTLARIPEVLQKISLEPGKKEQNRISIESKVDNLLVTVEIFNRPLQFGGKEKDDAPFVETRIQNPVANRLYSGVRTEDSWMIQK